MEKDEFNSLLIPRCGSVQSFSGHIVCYTLKLFTSSSLISHLLNFGANVFTGLLSKTLCSFYTNVLCSIAALLNNLNQPLSKLYEALWCTKTVKSFQNGKKKKNLSLVCGTA